MFRPLFAGKELDLEALVLPWLAAAGIMVVGLVLVLCVRPDPRTIAQKLHFDAGGGGLRRRPRRSARSSAGPGVLTALVAAVASFAGMVSVMNLTGYIVIDHGHHQSDVFTVISLHIVGMYALVLVVGEVDRRRSAAGRARSAGLLVMALSTLGLVWFESVLWIVGLALRARSRLEHLLRRGRDASSPTARCPPSGAG